MAHLLRLSVRRDYWNAASCAGLFWGIELAKAIALSGTARCDHGKQATPSRALSVGSSASQSVPLASFTGQRKGCGVGDRGVTITEHRFCRDFAVFLSRSLALGCGYA